MSEEFFKQVVEAPSNFTIDEIERAFYMNGMADVFDRIYRAGVESDRSEQ